MSIQADIGEKLPKLVTLALTNNNIAELSDLDPLSKCPRLEYLTCVAFLYLHQHIFNYRLVGNPVSNKPNYRPYVIAKLKKLRVLDFRRIKDAV